MEIFRENFYYDEFYFYKFKENYDETIKYLFYYTLFSIGMLISLILCLVKTNYDNNKIKYITVEQIDIQK